MVKLQNKCHLWFLSIMTEVICAKFKSYKGKVFRSSPPPSRKRVTKDPTQRSWSNFNFVMAKVAKLLKDDWKYFLLPV